MQTAVVELGKAVAVSGANMATSSLLLLLLLGLVGSLGFGGNCGMSGSLSPHACHARSKVNGQSASQYYLYPQK